MRKNTVLQGMRNANNYTTTANMALSHKSTLNAVLDYFARAGAMRGQDTSPLFSKSYATDPLLAIKSLFYVRDIRGGGRVGERETFRQGLRYLYNTRRDVFNALVPLIPVYGRWDDLMEFVDSDIVAGMVAEQLSTDLRIVDESDAPVSLIGKWMPSANTSSKETRDLARKWIRRLGIRESQYRHMLVALRKRIGIVEALMSAGKFDEINYEQVPSSAISRYRKAFSKRDADRYVAYLEAVKKGDAKINAATLYPYELVNKYFGYVRDVDPTIEAQWAALPNYAGTDDNAIVMADVSGSMSGRPMEVSVSLAIYFAERNHGPFANYFMTFSGHPELVEVIGNNLLEKVRNVSHANWNQNTNLQAALDLLLTTARRNNAPDSDMPRMLFIISDMQFDVACGRNALTNFEVMKAKYAAYNYTMPKVVFWNVNSFNSDVPVTEKEEGVYLVSGCSAGIFKSALQAEASNPYDMMVETLNDDRYAAIEGVLQNVQL